MPGIERYGLEHLPSLSDRALALGIPALVIFPCIDPALKDAEGSLSANPDNLTCRAIKTLRAHNDTLSLICDVALDPYTDHGHDGIIRDGVVDNDLTVDALIQQSLVQIDAGCDSLAPSDMMDGRIKKLRDALEERKLTNIRLISYAAKYASAFYGPFRQALSLGQTSTNLSARVKDEKRGYQMDIGNSDEAMYEIALDIAEGADSIIIKPAMPYLDIIQRAATEFPIPLIAYQVSGEYAMLHAAAQNDWLSLEKTMFESLLAFKRAGARAIISYFAPQAAERIKNFSS